MKYLIVIIALLIYSAGPRVSFKPFRLSFDSWLQTIAVLCIMISFYCIYYAGYKKGKERIKETVIEVLEERNVIKN